MKLNLIAEIADENESLPSRERGLKYLLSLRSPREQSSLPSRERGLKYYSQDNNPLHPQVAPFAGAWIEITLIPDKSGKSLSLPSRERGLKFVINLSYLIIQMSLPSRERGLKYYKKGDQEKMSGRSLRGSVD